MQTCCASRSSFLTTSKIAITRCPTCHTLWGVHTRAPDGRPWDESYVPDHFARALRMRRERQADAICDLLTRHVDGGRVLDYGCGQGVFLKRAVDRGLDAFGCDLDTDAPHSVAPPGRVIKVDAPWAMPDGDWQCVVMLDVLEHHAEPWQFLRGLSSRHVLLKVPSAVGPGARLARTAARLGRTSLLEQLFLVGENFPHHWLATRRGLTSLAADTGFEVVHCGAVTEVGLELPDRMRVAVRSWKRPFATLAGAGFGSLGPVWSDATVALLRRKE